MEYFITFPASAVAREGVRGMGGSPLLSTFAHKQHAKFPFPPIARGELRSRRSETRDARICYRTAQPRFRWWKRRRTALRSAGTSPSAERKPWTFPRKAGFRCSQTDGGQNAEAGPASTREILIPCAGLPAPPLQQIVKWSTSSLFQHPQLPGRASEGWGDPPF